MKKIIKIVITGGPCAGKTTALQKIKEYFESRGIGVMFVSETATELIMNGVAPWSLGSQLEMQKAVLPIQIAKEDAIFEAAKSLVNYDVVLVICDRGLMDGKAYLDNELLFDEVLRENNLTEDEILKRYDAVYHLVTAANGAIQGYTLSNNDARSESLEDALSLDKKTQYVWKNHKNFEVIDNSTNFNEKIMRLIEDISETVPKIKSKRK